MRAIVFLIGLIVGSIGYRFTKKTRKRATKTAKEAKDEQE